MNKNEKFVITINRELGSGGRTVGRKLAEKLGVEYYDKAVVKGLQEKYHLSAEQIEKLKGEKQNWWTEFKRVMQLGPGMSANYYLPKIGDEPDLLDSRDVYETEKEILNGIAAEESCVIAGRTGFHVSTEFRIARTMRKENVSEKEALKIIEKVDKMRENYVNEFTHTSRYDTRNYQLVITADGKTEDEIVDLIMMYIG